MCPRICLRAGEMALNYLPPANEHKANPPGRPLFRPNPPFGKQAFSPSRRSTERSVLAWATSVLGIQNELGGYGWGYGLSLGTRTELGDT
jgi:hypothetical protein